MNTLEEEQRILSLSLRLCPFSSFGNGVCNVLPLEDHRSEFSVCGSLQQQNDGNNNKWEKRRKLLQLLQQPRFLFIFLACFRDDDDDDDDDVRGEEQKYVLMSVTELITQQAQAKATTAAATPASDANNISIIIIINCSLAWILFGLMLNKAILAAAPLIEERGQSSSAIEKKRERTATAC